MLEYRKQCIGCSKSVNFGKPWFEDFKRKTVVPPEQLNLKIKEASVIDNWKNHFAYIKTSQRGKTNSGFNYEL